MKNLVCATQKMLIALIGVMMPLPLHRPDLRRIFFHRIHVNRLIGVMYTAPKRYRESDLNERIPLSIAQWHEHVNFCRVPLRSVSSNQEFRRSVTPVILQPAPGRLRPVLLQQRRIRSARSPVHRYR